MSEEKENRLSKFSDKAKDVASNASYGMDGSIIDIVKRFFTGIYRLIQLINEARRIRIADRNARREAGED